MKPVVIEVKDTSPKTPCFYSASDLYHSDLSYQEFDRRQKILFMEDYK